MSLENSPEKIEIDKMIEESIEFFNIIMILLINFKIFIIST